MKISASRLTRGRVQNDGESISLGLLDQNGKSFELEVSAADAGEIAVTLGQMVRDSFDKETGASPIREALPLSGWAIDATPDGTKIIMTFTADGGFEVSFVTEPAACLSLGSALTDGRY